MRKEGERKKGREGAELSTGSTGRTRPEHQAGSGGQGCDAPAIVMHFG